MRAGSGCGAQCTAVFQVVIKRIEVVEGVIMVRLLTSAFDLQNYF
jgi:hypothetical protein